MEDKIQTVYDEKDINNLFKILPSEIILQNFDKEKPIEEIISIENLSNNELDIVYFNLIRISLFQIKRT